MEQMCDGEISFDSVILTPLERWVDTELDLGPDVVEYLSQLAEKSNQSVDNVINHILADMLAVHLELSKLDGDTLLESGEKSPRILILENGSPVARVKMLRRGGKDPVLVSEKIPPKTLFESERPELVTNCDRLMQTAEI
ncbi:MAG: hypothetical protein II461_02470 [Treponema sp.]|nr:hypothetical protein [Treponema sp.]